jgi:LPXTG-motif cell wall-anchored protein
MTSPRLLLTLLALVPVFALVPAASGDPGEDRQASPSGSGGALATPLRQGEGGGSLAPAPSGPVETAPPVRAAPDVEAAQNQTPTTPSAEQQPGGERPSDLEGGAPQEQTTGPAATSPAGGVEGAAAGDSGVGFLPSTGFELAAIAALGLVLLAGGAALRPRRGRRAEAPLRRAVRPPSP